MSRSSLVREPREFLRRLLLLLSFDFVLFGLREASAAEGSVGEDFGEPLGEDLGDVGDLGDRGERCAELEASKSNLVITA